MIVAQNVLSTCTILDQCAEGTAAAEQGAAVVDIAAAASQFDRLVLSGLVVGTTVRSNRP